MQRDRLAAAHGGAACHDGEGAAVVVVIDNLPLRVARVLQPLRERRQKPFFAAAKVGDGLEGPQRDVGENVASQPRREEWVEVIVALLAH